MQNRPPAYHVLFGILLASYVAEVALWHQSLPVTAMSLITKARPPSHLDFLFRVSPILGILDF